MNIDKMHTHICINILIYAHIRYTLAYMAFMVFNSHAQMHKHNILLYTHDFFLSLLRGKEPLRDDICSLIMHNQC